MRCEFNNICRDVSYLFIICLSGFWKTFQARFISSFISMARGKVSVVKLTKYIHSRFLSRVDTMLLNQKKLAKPRHSWVGKIAQTMNAYVNSYVQVNHHF